ncbi:WD40-repeat-containing domain protein [Coniochaeta sp. 2T2.1]|nr:WD40-repeat-containing domain protein [Coniochaeta sp. 2T2.1]
MASTVSFYIGGKNLKTPRQDLVHCPITALAFYPPSSNSPLPSSSPSSLSSSSPLYVLAAEDANLKTYPAHYSPSSPRHQPCAKLRVFAEQSIHGISVSSAGNLLIWGAQSVAVIPKHDVDLLLLGGRQDEAPTPIEARACDWVYDGAISPYDENKGVLVTAHNEVVVFTVESSDGGQGKKKKKAAIKFGEMVFLSRPILYSTTVRWTAEDSVLVVSGTVFGEIVVWRCRLDKKGSSKWDAKVLFVFTGHEGSIFGVSLSPEVEVVEGRKQRLLASCSDDRTVRVWDVTENPEEEDEAAMGEERVLEVRETGFGENHNSETHETTDSVSARRCLAVAIGHASRIWHVRFACEEGVKAGPIELYSFGEDTTMQKWRLSGGVGASSPYPFALEHQEKTACHNGKHIWSCAVTSDGQGRSLTVTGGADGKITLLKGGDEGVAVNRATTRPVNGFLSLNDVLQSIPVDNRPPWSESATSAKDGFLRYAYLSEDKLLVSTTSGRLLLGDLAAGPSWGEYGISAVDQRDLRGYNVVRAVAPGAAIIGSASGSLYFCCTTFGVTKIDQLSGKITDVSAIPDAHVDSVDGSGSKLRFFVTTLGSAVATVFTLDGITSPTKLTVQKKDLALHIGNVVTSVGVCDDLLLLGSRKGGITVYQETPETYVHLASRNDCKTKGGDAVTSIITLPALAGSKHRYILTTCRDGKYRIYELRSSPTGLSLELRHETNPPLGPMLEGARLVRSQQGGDLDLIIYGFRSTNFIVWNETRQQEVASVACGGAHRTFDFFSDPRDANRLRFVYTKASAMGIFSQDEPSAQVLKQGGHGREIRAVAASSSSVDDDDGKTGSPSSPYIATGAEDTCIRIWDWNNKRNGGEEEVADMRCLALLQKHTAGLQALKWEGDGYLLSSAGSEEFFVWKVTTLESEYRGLAVVCEAAFPFRTADGDLRIVDFDSWTYPPTEAHPEGGVYLTMVFSNSVLKSYRYTRAGGFECVQTGRYTGACLTQVKQMGPLPGQHGQRVITGSTDGVVAVWKATSEDAEDEKGYQIVLTTQAHQNSVKTLDVAVAFNDRYYVFTGGDDNALCSNTLVAKPNEDGEPELGILDASRVGDAHAAAITGVKVLRQCEVFTFLATVSNDQRLKIWRVETSPCRCVALIYNSYSALADPGGLEVIDNGNLIVAGVGMEVWNFYLGRK